MTLTIRQLSERFGHPTPVLRRWLVEAGVRPAGEIRCSSGNRQAVTVYLVDDVERIVSQRHQPAPRRANPWSGAPTPATMQRLSVVLAQLCRGETWPAGRDHSEAWLDDEYTRDTATHTGRSS